MGTPSSVAVRIPVIDLNRRALDHLSVEKQLTIVAGATHLFEEPGALEKVAGIAAEWFVHYLSGTRRSG
jgi:hypothetical protein